MKPHERPVAAAPALCQLAMAIACGLLAWPVQAAAATAGSGVVPGERLSDWLLRQDREPGHAPGLLWTVPQEREPQARLKSGVLGALRGRHDRLAGWLETLPVTGRVAVAVPEARWLQAHPGDDPVLSAGHTVAVLAVPRQVTVVQADGSLCRLLHQANAGATDYADRCGVVSADWAWIAQPDGRTARVGVAAWNRAEQDRVAPGAWIWLPHRQADIADSVSDQLIRFLATQGPAPDDLASSAGPAPEVRRTRDPQLTASDWGEIGLLQTPTARMAPTGHARLAISHVLPYTRTNVMLQPLEWLEGGFRYTSVANRIYGITEQDFKDKSIDVKLRLAREGAWTPELALGVRDLGGTGLFSGEYLVANKRFDDFDFSLGLGWGYVGGRRNLGNPLSALSDSFRTRQAPDNVSGGTLNAKGLFRGPTALFGGVQWHTPWDPLLVKLEYDGNDYKSEPQDNAQKQRTPLNVGVTYRYARGVDLSAGIERGNRLMLGVTLYTDLDGLQAPKPLDPPAPVFLPQAPAQAPGWARTAADIESHTGWRVGAIREAGSAVTVEIASSPGQYRAARRERILALLHRDAPANVQRFVLRFSERGLPLHGHEVLRADWVLRHAQARPPMRQAAHELPFAPPAVGAAPWAESAAARGDYVPARRGFAGSLNPSFSQIIGGPDGFVLYQVGLQAAGEYHFSEQTWASGAVHLRLLDNYDKFSYTAPSELPRVRTFQREYVTTSRLNIPNLQATHVGRGGDNWTWSAYGGLLESMYAGVGGEWLYRAWHSPVAFGVDVNRVRQRGFRQDFRLRDYEVTTGHATLYWDTGWNQVQARISAGQYLAGDRGVTVDLSRRFDNGVVLGGYATKTNVSAAQFGEGSFDKGLYLSIPFDAMLPRSSSFNANFVWTPLTRDGGARLARYQRLFDLTSVRDPRAFRIRAPGRGEPRTGDRVFDPAGGVEVEDHGIPGIGDWMRSGRTLATETFSRNAAESWLWGATAIAGAALLDSRADRFSAEHLQGAGAKATGRIASALPFALAGGALMATTGLFGDDARDTGWTAVQSAGYALAANTALRLAVGRARPREGDGPHRFQGLKGGTASSSFPSNHAALAYAIATPFAQQYDMPWLYGVASLAGAARIQKREHWLSDVVGGAVVGYAVGSMLSDQQRRDRRMPRIALGLDGVSATWAY